MASLSTVLGLVTISDYALSTDQDNSSPAYYGFESRDGSWYIMKATTSGATITRRYVKGTSAYSTSWTNRATLTYDVPSVAL